MTSRRIVLATIGSLGDLHPMLALSLELARRGHRITIASTPYYSEKIKALGFAFHPLRPDRNPTNSALIAQCQEIKRGPEILFRELILPHLRDTYADLQAAVAGADLMLAGELVYAAPLVAEKNNLPWASVILSPTSFFSAYDPSLLVNIPSLYRLRQAGWIVNRVLLEAGKLASRHWWKPIRQLRRELGLRPWFDPVFRDKFSPQLVLALFSSVLARPQPDWPPQTMQPGFVFHDSEPESTETEAVRRFLSSGESPVVFTEGSTAVHHPGSFYETSIQAARILDRRALLVGASRSQEDSNVLHVSYASYARIFPEAAAIVHQGGSGTTGQALRAGRPQLIVPFGWDQPDNGARVARLGAGLCLERSAYTPATAVQALRRLLEEEHFLSAAKKLQAQIHAENFLSLSTASDGVEELLRVQEGNSAEK